MQYNSKLGLILFAVYLLFYGGFVLLNSFSPHSMESTPILGVNLAVLYGFGLIIAAFVLAMVYGVMCKPESEESSEVSAKEKQQ